MDIVAESRYVGAVSSEITLLLADGKTLTATITRDSAQAMGLAVGEPRRSRRLTLSWPSNRICPCEPLSSSPRFWRGVSR
ncbi:molybdopterin-binding protein [Phenylobacterium sp.]|uniref:TOBE domain-containing protein n=1 Tax=Phenylobacterium sp. TaxID=1871053 RepID=UPI00351D63D1